MCGEKDGSISTIPATISGIYALLLLSAIVQALFPAKTRAELLQRIDESLRRADVERRIKGVLTDFDLFGRTPFLQITLAGEPAERRGSVAVRIFRRGPIAPGGFSSDSTESLLPIALVMLFAEQTYAGGAGRGHKAGPGGQPGVFTLIDPGSVRSAAWANTLALEFAAQKYVDDAADRERPPWSSTTRTVRFEARDRARQRIVFSISRHLAHPRGGRAVLLHWRSRSASQALTDVVQIGNHRETS